MCINRTEVRSDNGGQSEREERDVSWGRESERKTGTDTDQSDRSKREREVGAERSQRDKKTNTEIQNKNSL